MNQKSSRKFMLRKIRKNEAYVSDEEIITRAYALCSSEMQNKEMHQTLDQKVAYVLHHYSVSLLSVYEDGSEEFIADINKVNEAFFCLGYTQIESRYVKKIGGFQWEI